MPLANPVLASLIETQIRQQLQNLKAMQALGPGFHTLLMSSVAQQAKMLGKPQSLLDGGLLQSLQQHQQNTQPSQLAKPQSLLGEPPKPLLPFGSMPQASGTGSSGSSSMGENPEDHTRTKGIASLLGLPPAAIQNSSLSKVANLPMQKKLDFNGGEHSSQKELSSSDYSKPWPPYQVYVVRDIINITVALYKVLLLSI